MTATVFIVLVVAAAYWVGRLCLGRRVFDWAEWRDRGSHGPGWWVAQAVGLVAVVWMLTVHPRRSAANRRSWREARNTPRSPAVAIPRAPAPQFDPDWATRRTATADAQPEREVQ